MPGAHTFYDGSQVLQPVAEKFGVEVDMLNLVFCQFISVPFAILYRKFLPPGKDTRFLRLTVPIILGVALGYFSYGQAIKHPISLAIISYCLMNFMPTEHIHKIVFIFAMGYLILIHWFRWYVLTSYYIDITGRIKSKNELTDIQKREALSELPSITEYLSYLFHFQTILTGPLCFYADYRNFIDGSYMNDKEWKRVNIYDAVFPKFGFAMFCMAVVGLFHTKFYPELLAEPHILALPLYQWCGILYFVSLVKRCQYYYAWIWADGVANLSGFGFNGYEVSGEPKWDLISNVNAYKVEVGLFLEIAVKMALSFKETLDGWNCTTMYWLRRVAYERVPKNYRTVSTYLLSALWHGFFLGYYLTFLTGALFTVSSRITRRCLRHRFQKTPFSRKFYDFITFIFTKVFLFYTTYPFMTMHLNPGLFIYRHLYFCLHFVALFGAVGLPLILPPKSDHRHKSE